MSKQSHVPKFGQWDANDQMPFTLVFDKARADHKGGTGAGNKVMNPNDPYENPERAKKGSYGGMRDNEGMGLREGQYSEQSPNHPSPPLRGRLGNRPVVPSNLAPDRKVPHEGGIPPHHGAKSRPRPASRGEDMFPERASALPKFGAWDEKDPTSGDNFTVLFSQARKEKIIGGPTQIPPQKSDSPLKADFDDAYKAPHQSFRQKVARCLCFRA